MGKNLSIKKETNLNADEREFAEFNINNESHKDRDTIGFLKLDKNLEMLFS